MESTSNTTIAAAATTTTTGTLKFSELPKELLEIIGKHLDSRIDVFRYRAISTSCRSVVSFSHLQSQSLSLNFPPPINYFTATVSNFTICRLEDASNSAACLVKVVESDSSGMLELHNPLTTQKTNHLPPFMKKKMNKKNTNNKKIINMLDFRLVELIKGQSFDFKRSRPGLKIKKAVLNDSNIGMFALIESGKLWYWNFGDENWTHLGNEQTYYDDFIVYKSRYYVIDSLGIISWIDDKSMNLVQYSTPLCGLGQVKSLVVSNGEFYVIDSYLEDEGMGVIIGKNQKVDIKVYKLDEEWGNWFDVKSIGNRVFVMEKEHSFSVSVEDFSGCEGDCIYFSGPTNFGQVFRFDTGSISSVESFPGHMRLFSPSMNWLFPTSSCNNNCVKEEIPGLLI